MYRFLLLFFLIIPFHLFAIDFEQTKDSLKIFQNDKNKAVVSFSIEDHFLVGHQAAQKIKEKYGSYKKSNVKYIASTSDCVIDEILKEGDSIICNGVVSGKNLKSKFSLVFIDMKDKIDYQISFDNPNINLINFIFSSKPETEYFGGGEQFSFCNFKGREVPIFVEENGIGRGDKKITRIAKLAGVQGSQFTSYAPIPYFMGTDNVAFSINNSTFSIFDFKNLHQVKIQIWDKTLHGSFWQANSPKELLTKYTQGTGRMQPLPEFAYGTIIGLQGGKIKVDSILKNSLAHKNPITAIWIQDWVGKRYTKLGTRLQWDWSVNEESYPNFKNWTDSLNRIGVKVLGYINPYLVKDGATCKYALEQDYVVKDKENHQYLFKAGGFEAYMIDFTNPEANQWYQTLIIENMLKMGLSGWMADFGENLPLDAKLFSGIDAKIYHNQYPVDWMKLNHDAVTKSGFKDILVFNRSGFTNTAKYSTSFWTGDQMGNYGENDGMLSAICALNSSGLSGIGINHSDIGGYTAIKLGPIKYLRSKDLLFRWMEMAAFTPIFRSHEGVRPEQMAQFYSDEESQVFFAKMGQIHASLKPLFEALTLEANTSGIPIIRHPYLVFPEDKNTYSLSHQFMLGDSLMVIPTTVANSDSNTGYLPKGKWQHYFTNEIVKGGKYITVASPYGTPTVFKRLKEE